ncbi:surface protein/Bartonella adhesin [Bartonella kosoyi]|uniref:Surface protein/Bartonella adhesin n=4 Tax=Bartonella TaxID=773 RepID=A0A5B9CWN6_9HYPH|nr:Vomp family autotransporter [Bartonella kosoyi]QEE08460.1 surface protein/Bartonella adhesin [Bartonella kosoyi]
MKKLYATQRASTLKVFRFSFVKALSLATATTFLSNISPVFASNLAITGAKVLSQDNPNVNYSKGSHGSIVLSGDDDYCGADNVIGRGGTTKRGGKKITAEEEYRRFLEEVKFGNFSPYSHSDKQLVWTGNGQTSGNIGYMGGLTSGDANIMPEAFGVYSFATGCGSAAQGSYSTAFGANATALTGGSLAFGVASLAAGKVSIAVGVGSEAKGDSSVALGGLANAAGEISVAIGHKAQSTGKFAITMGDQAQATKEDSLAIGRMAHALGKSSTALGSEYNVKSEHGDNDYTTAQGDYSTALGAVSKALEYGSTAVGHRAYATQKEAVSIGFYSRAKADHAVALGADSIATVEAGVAGYSPFLQGVATDTTFTWKSTYGAVSVGDITNGKTRQIGGVAAGSANTDAVNVAQLKSLKMYVDKGWKLSVDGKNAKAVGIDNTVDFATGSNNLSITKGEKDNNIKFDLAKNITLDSVTAGKNIFDATGLKITDGPQITTAGINAGSKRITNVANGTDTTDAVNFGQLDKAKKEVQEQVEKQVQEVEKQIASNSFVKQDAVTQHITIGKDTGGDKIDITNNNKETRTLTGIKNGDISKDSKEAVTGSQLFETNQSVNTVSSNLQTAATDIAKSFGGGAGYKDGKWTDPTFTVKTVTDEGNEENATYHNVAEALTGVGTSITNVKNEITKEVNNTINTVKGDSLLWSADDQAFSAQHKNEGAKANSKITHLLDGNIASGSTDAITGNQLYSLGDKVATYFGGNARYENGVWTDPTFKIKRVKADGTEDEQNYTSVAAAFEGVGTAFTNIKNEMTNQINNAITNVQGDSLIKKDPKTNYITIGKEVAGGEINIANNANEARTLSGVKDAVKNNEAVNKGQFDKGIENVSKDITNKFNDFTQNITNITQQVQGDALLWSESENAFIAAHGKDDAKTNSKITHLLDGNIASDSTDAITGKQLYTLGDKVAQSFGGDARYENGEWTSPTFKIKTVNGEGEEKEETYKNVSEALTGVGTSITNVQNKVTEQINNVVSQVAANSFVQQDDTTKRITIGAKEEGSEINIANKNNEDRILSGVKEATKNNEAVNKAQLDTNIKKVEEKLAEAVGNVTQQVQGDALLWSNTDNAFVADHKKDGVKTKSKITHLSDGNIASGSTDAVTGGQLYSMNEQLATYLGGGAGYDEKGNWKAPSFKVKTVKADGNSEEKNYSNVSAAFEGVGTSITNVQNKITNEITNQINHLQSDDSAVVHYDKQKNGAIDYASVTFGGKDKTLTALHNIADGQIADKSHDAITGGQINSISQDVARFLGGGAAFSGGAFTQPTYKLSQVDANGKVNPTEFKDVGSAFSGLDENIKNVNDRIKEVSEGVAQDSLNWNEKENAFVAKHGDEKTNSKIKYLANGDINSSSSDAVAGSQLYSLGSNVAQSLGGGAGYENGKWIAPTFKVKTVKDDGASGEESYSNVAEALTGVGTSFTNIKNEITNQINHLQSDDSAVVHYDKKEKDEIDYTSVTFGKGKDSAAVGLHNVADGQIADKSHDAVTGGQINTLSQDVAHFLGGEATFKDGTFTGPTYKLSSVSEEGTVTDKSFTDVGSAFSGLDNNIKNVNDRIKEVSEGVAQDSLSWSKDDNAFSAQHGEGKERKASKITHVLDGNIASGSTDAVTGGQLYSMNNTLASYFGGGAEYKEGKWVSPNFKVNTVNVAGNKVEEKSYDNVSAAFEGVGSSFTNLHNEVTNAITDINNHINDVVSDSLVKQDADSKVIKIGAETGGTSINIANSGDAARTLTGVKAGALTETSTDAVNGSQLYSMNNTLASYFGGGAEYKGGKWVSPNFKVNTVSADGDKVEEKSYKTVAEAFAGVGSSFTNIHKELKNEINQVVGDSLVKQDEKTHVIAVGGEKSGTKVTFANTDGAARALTDVKAGELTEASTDAVNGSQLFATNQNVTTVTNDLKTVSDNTSKSLGGGADVLKGVSPTYTVQDKSYQSVADAFGGVDRSFTKLHEEITQNTNDVSENIKQNALLWSDEDHAFVATHGTDGDKKNSKITSLANGSVTEGSTDAINGSQLYETNQHVSTVSKTLDTAATDIAKSFGGGAKYESDQWIAPTFKVLQFSGDGKSSEETYNNVADAFAGVNSSFKGIHNEMTNAVTNINNQIDQVVSDSLVKKDATTNLITIGKEVAGTEVNIANKDQEARTLSGVKAAVNDNEAVNKGQLDKSLEQLSNSLQSDDSAVVLYDKKDNGETDYASVTFGKGQNAAPVALHNIADGQIADKSHDAVTGGQINTLSQDVAHFLGGEATFKDGTFTGPTYKLSSVSEEGTVTDKSFTDVGSAFSGLDNNIKNVNDRIKEVSEGVAQDSLSWSKDDNAFSAQHGEGKERKASKITHVLDGNIASGSTDAVTGGQLYSMNNTLASYFGGGAEYKEGKWVSPNFKVNTVNVAGNKVEEKSYDNVSAAFEGVGSSFTNLHNEVTNAITDINNHINDVVSDSLVKQDADSKVIKIGAETGGTSINIANSGDAARTLTGVKAGALTETSTDAVNGSQLYSMNNTLASYLGGGAGYDHEGKWSAPSFKVKKFDDNGKETEQEYTTVAEAFEGVNQSFTNIHNEVNEQINQVVGDSLVKQNEKTHVISVGGETNGTQVNFANSDGIERVLSGVKAGKLSANSTEAVNGSQLYSLGDNVAQYFGGGAEYKEGNWTGPSFKVKTVKDNGESEEQEYKNVAEALTGVGTSFTNIKNEITNQINHLQSDDSAVVHYDKNEKDEIDYTSVTLGKGKNSTAVGLHNVADGQIANGSHDAITGGQINTIGESIAKFLGGEASFKEGGLTQPTYKLSDVSTEGKVTDKTFTDVGSAFTGLDKNIKNVNDRIKEVSEGVAQDSLLWSNDHNAFVATHGEKKANSRITSLADGNIASGSTDAITGNQLYSLNSMISTYLGGGTKYENGVWTAPDFKVKQFNKDGHPEEQIYHNVADAFAGVSTSITDVHNEVNNQISQVVSDSLVKQAKETDPITIGKEVAGTEVNIANKDREDRTLSGIKAAEKDNEAVNKAQLDQSLEKLSHSLQSDDSAVVLYDKKENGETDYTNVTLGKGQKAAPVALHNVADGQIADKSHDAVTGGQINTISQDVAKFLGGDTSFEKGVFTGPSYKLSSVDTHGQVKSTEFKDVGSAFAGLDTNIKNVNDRIKEVSEGVAQDSLSWSQDDNAFSAQHGEGKDRTASKITHILDGNVTKGSTDAVNGSQLYSMNNTLASYLGGGAEYKEGSWVAPSFTVNTVNTAGDKVEEKSYDSVAAAFEGVGSSFTNLHNEVTNAVTDINNHINNVVSDSLVKQDAESKVIKIGAEKGGTSINIANSGDAARTLTGVKAGSLTEASTDAVNGSQLYSMNNTLAGYLGGGAEYKEGKWAAPSFKVHTVSSDGSKVEEQSYNTVAEAFAGVGSSFTNIHKELKNEINQVVGDSLVKQDEQTHVIAVGGEKSGTEVTFANTDGASRSLTGVKAGALTETSTDAVNGSQLFATNQNVTTVRNDLKTVSENTSKYLGGGADVLKGVAPTYTVQDKSYQSVAEAFSGVDRSFTQLHEEISKNTNEVSENIKQNALLWSESEKAFSAQHGEGKERTSSKITSLANGDITANSTDAVNGSQLYSMNNTLASYFGGGAKFENGQWISPSFKVNTVSADGSKVEEQSYDDVAKAFASVGTSFSNLHNEMTNAVTNINNQISQVVSDNLVKQDATTNLINIGKEVAGSEINIANKDQGDRTLSGVKAAENDNEAVNKAQLDQSLEQLSNSLQSDDSAVVLYDKKENGETDYTSVTLGKGSNAAPVALHNVADGQIAENSHDAVTGGQINTISQDVAKFLGGDTAFKDGTFTGPTYKLSQVDEKGEAHQAEFKDVGSAFTGLDTNIKNVNNHLTNVVQDFTQQITDITEEVKGDALLWSEDKEAFVATHGTDAEKKNSKITSLANGDITANSTDAVNGSQLYSMNNTLASYFGGGAKFENGQWISPSFKVNTVSADGSKVEEQSYDDVAKAFASVGTSFSNLHNELKNEISQVVSDSLVKQDEESKVIKIGAEKEGTEITIANSDGAVRSLSGVKAGTLSADSTEAVNGSQLYSMNQTLASYFGGGAKFENGQWISPSFKILSFNEDGSSEETSYNNVAAAFAGVNQSFTKLHHELSETVEQNALLWSDADESFVALHGKGSEKHNSKLSHLVDGDISAGSTEAITGNQLYHLNQTLAAYLGGGARYQGGQWTAPEFQITQFKSDGSSSESKSYDNVAGAFEGVNGSLSGINDRINNVAENVTSNSLSWNEELGGYDGRHDGKDSKITHVADGDISEGSKEVVNGGQLWETNQKVSAVENRVESIDQHVKDVESAVTNGAVNYDKDADGNKTNKVTLVGGNESDPVLIDNVAEGRIESGSKEAINGGQLHDYTEQQMKIVLEDAKKYTDDHITDIVNNGVSESKAYTDMKFETLNYAVEDVRKEARQAAAIGLAVSNLSYDDTPGKLSFSFGSGLWRSQSAFAIGAGYMSENGKIRSNVSATSAGGHWGVGAGFRITLN